MTSSENKDFIIIIVPHAEVSVINNKNASIQSVHFVIRLGGGGR